MYVRPERNRSEPRRKVTQRVAIISPSTGAVNNPVCSNAVEHSKQAASLDASELNSLAILTKRQAAAYLQTTSRFLERRVASGRLRAYRPTGKLWRVRRSDLDAFLESGASIRGDPQWPSVRMSSARLQP